MDAKIHHSHFQPRNGLRPPTIAILGRNKPGKADSLATEDREGLQTGAGCKQCLPCSVTWSTGGHIFLPLQRKHVCPQCPPPPADTLLACLWCAPMQGKVGFGTRRPAPGIGPKGSIKPRTTSHPRPATSCIFLKRGLK